MVAVLGPTEADALAVMWYSISVVCPAGMLRTYAASEYPLVNIRLLAGLHRCPLSDSVPVHRPYTVHSLPPSEMRLYWGCIRS